MLVNKRFPFSTEVIYNVVSNKVSASSLTKCNVLTSMKSFPALHGFS